MGKHIIAHTVNILISGTVTVMQECGAETDLPEEGIEEHSYTPHICLTTNRLPKYHLRSSKL
jgi:hypothetical protein